MTANSKLAQAPSPAEIAFLVKVLRDTRQWSQEQLAEISGLNVRTVQRVEQGEAASLDTRRAIARAFGFEDIDLLSKPIAVPSETEMKAAREQFERENIVLPATPLTSGRVLARLAETHSMDMSEPAFEMTREADEAFAALVDYFRDYRDCADVYSESQKLEVYDELQSHIDALRRLSVSLCHASRKVRVKFGGKLESQPLVTTVLYVVAFPLGKEPSEFATPRTAGIKL